VEEVAANEVNPLTTFIDFGILESATQFNRVNVDGEDFIWNLAFKTKRPSA
jgi:hypothetical protein